MLKKAGILAKNKYCKFVPFLSFNFCNNKHTFSDHNHLNTDYRKFLSEHICRVLDEKSDTFK